MILSGSLLNYKGPFQTRPVFGEIYNLFGCLVSALLCLAGWCRASYYPDADCVNLYKQGMRLGYISEELYKVNKEPLSGCIVKDIFKFFNFISPQYKIIGARWERTDYVPKARELCVLQCRHDDHPGEHYVVSNGQPNAYNWRKEVFHDPIETHHNPDTGEIVEGSLTVALGKITARLILVLDGTAS